VSDLDGLSEEGRKYLRGSRGRACEYMREQIRADIKMLKSIGHDATQLEGLLEESDGTLLATLVCLDVEETPEEP
jgi:hypothetical protein